MKIKQWGEEVWEEKVKSQGGVGVVSGTNASLLDVKKKVKEFFNIFDKNFVSFIPKEGKILDCGVGPLATHAIEFSKRGYQVTGVDISKTALDFAKKEAERFKQKINFEKDNLVDLNNVKGQFDLVFCAGTFGHIPAYLALDTIRAFKRKTKRNGVIVIHFWIEKPKTFSNVIKNFLYQIGHIIKRSLNMNAFNVNCVSYTEEEIGDLCNRSNLRIVKKVYDYYLLREIN